ncbi:MAG: Hcp family type VI secretion system effector [Candidatus Kariarchaeaceae archaeon]|jgi:type VI secretion system secreted protein Hcp
MLRTLSKKQRILGFLNVTALIIFLIVSAYQGIGQKDELSLSQGGTSIFLKIDGINGEALDKDHKDWIDVLSFSFGGVSPQSGATGATRRRGSVVLSDFVIVKEIDKSSAKIFEKMTRGEVIPKVEIEVTASYTGSGRVPYLYYELKNVMVTSYTISAGGEVPVETFTLNFEEVLYRYTEYDNAGASKGNVEASYKVEEGES